MNQKIEGEMAVAKKSSFGAYVHLSQKQQGDKIIML